MKKLYTNEIIQAKVGDNGVMLPLILGMLGVAVLLAALSFINTARDMRLDMYAGRSFFSLLTDQHPLGLVFGITLLILAGIGMGVDGTLNLIKHYRPACGETKFSREQIDEQASDPKTEYMKSVEIFLAPDMLIGIRKGVTAVAYGEVDSLQVTEHYYSKREGMKMTPRLDYLHTKDMYYYHLIARTKGGKKLLLSQSGANFYHEIEPIRAKIAEHNPDVKVLEMRKSVFTK